MPGPNVNLSIGPPPEAYTKLDDYAGGANLTYLGLARSFQGPQALTYGTVTKANPCQITITGHGLTNGQTITIAGGTGDWAGINGIQVVTVVDGNNITIPVNTTAYTGTFAGTITFNGPRTSSDIWAIQKFVYNISNNLIGSYWAKGTTGEVHIWDNRATLEYE